MGLVVLLVVIANRDGGCSRWWGEIAAQGWQSEPE